MFADCLASILGKKPGFFLILSVSPLLPAMFTVTWTLYRDPSYPYDQRCILPGAHILFWVHPLFLKISVRPLLGGQWLAFSPWSSHMVNISITPLKAYWSSRYYPKRKPFLTHSRCRGVLGLLMTYRTYAAPLSALAARKLSFNFKPSSCTFPRLVE